VRGYKFVPSSLVGELNGRVAGGPTDTEEASRAKLPTALISQSTHKKSSIAGGYGTQYRHGIRQTNGSNCAKSIDINPRLYMRVFFPESKDLSQGSRVKFGFVYKRNCVSYNNNALGKIKEFPFPLTELIFDVSTSKTLHRQITRVTALIMTPRDALFPGKVRFDEQSLILAFHNSLLLTSFSPNKPKAVVNKLLRFDPASYAFPQKMSIPKHAKQKVPNYATPLDFLAECPYTKKHMKPLV
jgi:hypothetical protein